MSQTAPPRSRSSPRCCSWPPFSELGRGTCTCPRRGTGTCTQWPRRAGCCADQTDEVSDPVSHQCISLRIKHIVQGSGSPFHEVDHVDDPRCTDHGLVGENSPHGLFHTELGLQGRQKRLDLLPEWKEKSIDQSSQAQNSGDFQKSLTCSSLKLPIMCDWSHSKSWVGTAFVVWQLTFIEFPLSAFYWKMLESACTDSNTAHLNLCMEKVMLWAKPKNMLPAAWNHQTKWGLLEQSGWGGRGELTAQVHLLVRFSPGKVAFFVWAECPRPVLYEWL